MENLKYVCPCLLGVEKLVSNELKRMGASSIVAENGRVFFSGDYNILSRANICSRYAERVLILLGSFKALSFEELFEKTKNLPWENFIEKKDAFPVKGRSINSKLHSIPDCQSIIKKAVVERLNLKYHLSWFEETDTLYQIQFLIMKDTVSLMIDTSGVGLHKRGYRKNATAAPIKETLAAAMANLAHVHDDSFLYDPFCGSGTILIESALYALNIAPGLKRKFAAEKFSFIDKNIWAQERERAIDSIKKDVNFKAFGSDIDNNAINLSIDNIKKAGLSPKINIKKSDVKDFKFLTDSGILITNPPYGERLLNKDNARKLYEILGQICKKNPQYKYYVISPDENFENFFNKKSNKKRKIYNGMIKCNYFMYY